MEVLKPATKLIAVCIIFAAAAASIIFAASQYLKFDYPQPVRVYGAYPIYMGEEDTASEFGEIPYIQCQAGKYQAESISFENYPIRGSGEVDDYDTKERYWICGEQTLEYISGRNNGQIEKEPVTLTKATVQYSNDTKEEYDIGKIVLYPITDQTPHALSAQEFWAGKEGSQLAVYRTEEPLIIESVQCIPELENYHVQIEKFESIKGKQLSEGTKIRIRLETEKDGMNKYEPAVKVTYTTKDGKRQEEMLFDFEGETPVFSPDFFQMYDYLKEREVIG